MGSSELHLTFMFILTDKLCKWFIRIKNIKDFRVSLKNSLNLYGFIHILLVFSPKIDGLYLRSVLII